MHKKIMVSTLFLGSLLFMGAGCFSLTVGNEDPVTTGPGGVFTSADQGETWQSSSLYPTVDGVKNLQSLSVYKFASDPFDSKTFYWGSRGNGIFYTTDNAKSWSRASAPLNNGFIYDIGVHPKDHCTLYTTSGKSVYRTTDCVRSWSEVYRETSTDNVRGIAIDPFEPYSVFLVKEKGDVLQSIDGGVSWQVFTRMKKNSLIGIFPDPNKQGRLYIATRAKGLYRSDDSGKTWIDLSSGLKKFAGALTYRDMLVYPSKEGVLYWVSSYGILRSDDAGDSWTPFSLITPPGSAKIYAFEVNPKNEKEIYYAATIGIRSTFYRSIDGGKTWITKKLPSDQVPTALRIDPEQEHTLYLGLTIPPKD